MYVKLCHVFLLVPNPTGMWWTHWSYLCKCHHVHFRYILYLCFCWGSSETKGAENPAVQRHKQTGFCLLNLRLSVFLTAGLRRVSAWTQYHFIPKRLVSPLKGPDSLPHTAPLALCLSHGNCRELNTECRAKHPLHVQLRRIVMTVY